MCPRSRCSQRRPSDRPISSAWYAWPGDGGSSVSRARTCASAWNAWRTSRSGPGNRGELSAERWKPQCRVILVFTSQNPSHMFQDPSNHQHHPTVPGSAPMLHDPSQMFQVCGDRSWDAGTYSVTHFGMSTRRQGFYSSTPKARSFGLPAVSRNNPGDAYGEVLSALCCF